MATLAPTFAALTLALLGLIGGARADVFIVVNAASPVKNLTRRDVIDLYTGRTRLFPDGEAATVLDQARDSPARAQMYQQLMGVSLAQINSYWSRLTFTGQTLPPQALGDEAAVAEAVRRNVGAIGYLTTEPTDRALRVVLILRGPAGGGPAP